MIHPPVLSDQLYNWSDHGENALADLLAPEARLAPAPASRPQPCPPRLSHRALQTLRKAGLRVCPDSRPWPQVLPLRQPSWTPPRDGLHSLRIPTGRPAVARQSGPDTRHPRRGVPDQPRTSPPPREALTSRAEVRQPRGNHGCVGSRPGKPPHRQHGRGCPRRASRQDSVRRGGR
jgi:hypothetical protein